jgi:hypothetical protein
MLASPAELKRPINLLWSLEGITGKWISIIQTTIAGVGVLLDSSLRNLSSHGSLKLIDKLSS